MKKRYYIILLFLFPLFSNAQNLISNGDMELYTNCPTTFSQFNLDSNWINPTNSSPDYFNSCSFAIDVHIPGNNYGYQPAHSGNGYAGAIMYYGPQSNTREYIEGTLNYPLRNNTCYTFEMYVCLAENSVYCSRNFEVYFSDTSISGILNNQVLPFTPQITSSIGIVTDTLHWTLIKEDYHAHGGEKYLIIGNFNDDTHSTYQTTGYGQFYTSYYYIDDVSLSICTTGIDEVNRHISAPYPNPFSEHLTIDLKHNISAEIRLYDILSRPVLEKEFSDKAELNTGFLTDGIYFYEVRTKNGVVGKGKLLNH
jgi:hypothetical protein